MRAFDPTLKRVRVCVCVFVCEDILGLTFSMNPLWFKTWFEVFRLRSELGSPIILILAHCQLILALNVCKISSVIIDRNDKT